MNKIYKVIWSKAKNCYVVASELAKRHTKGSGARSLNRAAVTLGIVAGLTVGMTGSAWAADETRVVTSVVSAGTGTGFQITVSEASLVAGDNVEISYVPISGADEPDGKITIGVNANGEINSGVTGLVTGGTVYTAITGGTLDLNGSSITAVGNATVGGDLTAAGGALVVTKAIAADPDNNIEAAPANLTVTGDATVTGDTTVGGTLTVTGDISGKNINGITRVTDPGTPTPGTPIDYYDYSTTPPTITKTETTTTTEKSATTTIERVMSVTREYTEEFTTTYDAGDNPTDVTPTTTTDTAYSVNIGSYNPDGAKVNLNVYGDTTITGEIKGGGGKFTVDEDGTTTIGIVPVQDSEHPENNIDGVPANLVVTGDTTVGGTLDVTGTTTTKGIRNTNGLTTDTLNTTGNAGVGGTLEVTDATTLNGGATVANGLETDTLTVTGDSDLQGNATVGGDLAVTGATAVGGTLAVAGDTTIGEKFKVTASDGSVSAAGENFTVDGAGNTAAKGTLTVDKATTLKDKLSVAGDTTIGEKFKVTASDGSVSAAGGNFTADKDGNVKAAGKLTVGGEALFNEGAENQIQIDSTGIRIGKNSTQVDNKGFYAGGHNWGEAKAAFNSKGEIKGAGGAFTVDAGGTTTIKSNKKGNDNKITLNADEGSITTTGAVKMAPGRVAPGSTDAVTGGQMYSMREDLQSDINRVGAGAAAMSNLRPVDMGNKFSMAMGVGNYRSKTAMAMGLFYKPSDQVMLNMSGTIGSGHNMIGAGISFALDKVVKPTGSSVAVSSAQVVRLEEENKAIKAELAELKAAIKAMQKQKQK